MKTPEQANGEAMSVPPDANDIQAYISRLLTLIDISYDLVGDITAHGMSPDQKGTLFNAQNMVSVTWDLLHKLDKDFDAYMARPKN